MNEDYRPKSGVIPDSAGAMTANDFDDFRDDIDFGRVIGSREPGRPVRHGVDKERIIGIGRNALRFRPLARHGWARAAIAYGPYRRRAGLSVAFHLLNSHNGAETYELEPIVGRLRRWLLASETDSVAGRLCRWPRRARRETTFRRLACWLGSGRHCGPVTRVMYELRPLLTRVGDRLDRNAAGASSMDPREIVRRVIARIRRRYYEAETESFETMRENLALGWFPSAVPDDPREAGDCLVVRGAGPHNGELTARVAGRLLPLFRDLPNIPMVYVVTLRSVGAMYYAASLPGVAAVAEFPMMRPLAIDVSDMAEEVYAGVHPAVMGEVGFSADAILRSVKVADLPDHGAWYGTAVVADALTAAHTEPLRAAERGGDWIVAPVGLQRTPQGAASSGDGGTALSTADAPVGLVHALVELRSATAEAAIVWRSTAPGSFWEFSVSVHGGVLRAVDHGTETMARRCSHALPLGVPVSVQVHDHGASISVSLDGAAGFEAPVPASADSGPAGVGFRIAAGAMECFVRSFEAHPRAVPVPPQLLSAPGWIGEGTGVVVSENFAGPKATLDGFAGADGTEWHRIIGSGRFDVDGNGGAQVDATPAAPVPGRTAYAIDWDEPAFADIAVRIDVPGTGPGDGNACRGGLIFWQDPDNYFIVNIWLDDVYPSAAASSFFYLNGFEDVYDAVWTNLGDRVTYGGSYELRVVFDGDRYCVRLNDEPVLYRAISDVYLDHRKLEIRKVGLVANWEWGLDTGSRFSSFVARTGRAQP